MVDAHETPPLINNSPTAPIDIDPTSGQSHDHYAWPTQEQANEVVSRQSAERRWPTDSESELGGVRHHLARAVLPAPPGVAAWRPSPNNPSGQSLPKFVPLSSSLAKAPDSTLTEQGSSSPAARAVHGARK